MTGKAFVLIACLLFIPVSSLGLVLSFEGSLPLYCTSHLTVMGILICLSSLKPMQNSGRGAASPCHTSWPLVKFVPSDQICLSGPWGTGDCSISNWCIEPLALFPVAQYLGSYDGWYNFLCYWPRDGRCCSTVGVFLLLAWAILLQLVVHLVWAIATLSQFFNTESNFKLNISFDEEYCENY